MLRLDLRWGMPGAGQWLRVNRMGMLFAMAVLLAGCTPSQPRTDPAVDAGESLSENQLPNVQAGSDQAVNEGASVTLSGIASDPDGPVQTYRWEQLSGTSVSIAKASQASASFTAPRVSGSEELTFRLTVADSDGATASDEMAVTVAEYGQLEVALSGNVKHYSTYAGIPGAGIRVRQFDGVSRVVAVAETTAGGQYSVQVRANPGRLTVSAGADGFASQSTVVDLAAEAAITADLNMVPVLVEQQFQPENETEVLLDGQAVVSLPAKALADADGGDASGAATVRVTVLDATRDSSVMPGEFERWNATSREAEPIESFGAMNVVFENEAGSPLDLADGRQASISIPLASGRRPEDSPASVPLFYWSEARGYWIEEGEAVLEELAPGRWAYTGQVEHFSTWNADSLYDSIKLSGCVNTEDGQPLRAAEVTARGSDYVGSSKATTSADGQFEIQVRPDSDLELFAVAAGPLYSEAARVRSESSDMTLGECLVVSGDQGLRDFPMQITGETGSLEICVRDHECEDGDRISVDADGQIVFSGEIVNEWACHTLEVEGGRSYSVELMALNGTGYKGSCSYADANTGEIRVTGENTETQVWRHRGGAGSRARIIVETTFPAFPVPEMQLIPAGSFRMGDLTGESRFSDGSTSELPVQQVTIRRPFEMGKFEVTVAEYNAYLSAINWELRDAEGRGNHPVKDISLAGAKAYAEWLSEQTGRIYRLPSEAEWEYAARAGTETNFYWGNNPSGQHANGDKYSDGNGDAFSSRWMDSWPDDGHYDTTPVGSFIPNAFGLYDMSGNIAEYTENGIVRGGSHLSDPTDLRSSNRANSHGMDVGFRLVREVQD
ncbi:MAG: SUMF1/EgtB/PvdO family nonheme iron enzyme [Acidobacteria bacterium]|nr:SUMF1/EgtB/PvdO family nonheme iron enzyme [Acidobacteriota bacterium]